MDIERIGEFDVNITAVRQKTGEGDNIIYSLELTIENPSGNDKSHTLSLGGSLSESAGASTNNLSSYRSFVEKGKMSLKNWFGDWENDPANSSKVLDENGEPIPVYHGSFWEFTEFDPDMGGDNLSHPHRGISNSPCEEEWQGLFACRTLVFHCHCNTHCRDVKTCMSLSGFQFKYV